MGCLRPGSHYILKSSSPQQIRQLRVTILVANRIGPQSLPMRQLARTKHRRLNFYFSDSGSGRLAIRVILTNIQRIAWTNRLPLLRVVAGATSGNIAVTFHIKAGRLLLLKLLPGLTGQPALVLIQLDVAERRPVRGVSRRNIRRHLLGAETTYFLRRVALPGLVDGRLYHWEASEWELMPARSKIYERIIIRFSKLYFAGQWLANKFE